MFTFCCRFTPRPAIFSIKKLNSYLVTLLLVSRWCHATPASMLPDGRIHFGYKDGISQPNITGLREYGG